MVTLGSGANREVRMIDKYGEEVLQELEEEKQNKEEKEAAVS